MPWIDNEAGKHCDWYRKLGFVALECLRVRCIED